MRGWRTGSSPRSADWSAVQSYCMDCGGEAIEACQYAAGGCAATGTFVVGDERPTYCDRHYLRFQGQHDPGITTGAAAKARISGEVSFIRKKPVKGKRGRPPKGGTPRKLATKKPLKPAKNNPDHEEQTEEDSPKDDEQQDEKPKDETETGGDTPRNRRNGIIPGVPTAPDSPFAEA